MKLNRKKLIFAGVTMTALHLNLASAASVSIPDYTNNPVDPGAGYTVTNSLGTTISNDAAVYMVGTMSFAADASTANFNTAQFYAGATEKRGFGKRFNTEDFVLVQAATTDTGFDLSTVTGVTTTISFALKMNQLTGETKIWINPNLAGTEAAAGTPTATDTVANQNNYTDLVFRSTSDANTVTHSNFEVHYGGDTPFAAIPEPSSTALLGLGGLALILRRRR